MSKNVKITRAYHSRKRSEQAAATQRDIVEAARDLFLSRGYAQTTVSEIAAHAGVAPETVYAIFRNKGSVLARLIDVSLVGDYEEVPVLSRDWIAKVKQEPDQRLRLKALAHVTRAILERAGPIHALMRAAAANDAEMAKLRLTHQAQRLAGQTEFVRFLADAGPLRPGLSLESAGELYWIQASPELYTILTQEMGWSQERYEEWLYQSLSALLLPSPDA